MREKDFVLRLEQAKKHPDLYGALLRLGFGLKRVGHGVKYNCTEYKLTTAKGVSGDLSALCFCENADGTWRVLDNKQRFGKLTFDAIGCLTEFFDHTFDEAVCALTESGVRPVTTSAADICGSAAGSAFAAPSSARPAALFKLPQKCDGRFKNLFAFLASRGISGDLVRRLVGCGLLYQTDVQKLFPQKSEAELIKTFHSQNLPIAVFPVYDENGIAVGADSCAAYNLKDFRFKHVCAGSNASYGWRFANHVDTVTPDTPLFFCESAIDAMSLCLLTGYEGVYISMSGCKDVTFEGMCRAYCGRPVICTDNDAAGNKFRARHPNALSLLPKQGKDWNDNLKYCIENKIPLAVGLDNPPRLLS